MSITAVRAQAMCLLGRVGWITPAAKEAVAMRMEKDMRRDRRVWTKIKKYKTYLKDKNSQWIRRNVDKFCLERWNPGAKLPRKGSQPPFNLST